MSAYGSLEASADDGLVETLLGGNRSFFFSRTETTITDIATWVFAYPKLKQKTKHCARGCL